MSLELNTPFCCYNSIINGTLQTLEEVYFKAMGDDATAPADSRIAKDPLGVILDMVRIMQGAAARIAEAKEAVRELSLDE